MQRLRFVTLCYANYGIFFLEIHQNHQEKVMHFWCTFESASKVHQNPMKVHQKCIMFFWRFWWFFQKNPMVAVQNFHFQSAFIQIRSQFWRCFAEISLILIQHLLHLHCAFENASQVQLFLWGLSLIASWLHFQKCNQSVMDFGKFSHCMSPTKFHWRAAH